MDVKELSRVLLNSPPQVTAGRFSTEFNDGTPGEEGECLFLSDDRWAVQISGAALMWADGKRRYNKDRSGVSRGRGSTLASRPPWSMAVPRAAPIFGRPGDDWVPMEASEIGDYIYHIGLISMDSDFTASVVVDVRLRVLLKEVYPSHSSIFDPYGSNMHVGPLTSLLEGGRKLP